MRCNSDYAPEKCWSFAHLPRTDREDLLKEGAIVPVFYETALRKKEPSEIVRLYQYVTVTGRIYKQEKLRNNRIVLEDPRLAHAA